MATKAAKAAAQQDEHQALLATLQQRFEQHPQRHPTITWAQVQARLGRRAVRWKPLQPWGCGC